MAFRDDKDALVERLADLERDLAETREGLERKDEELKRLRERLGGLDQKSSKPRPTAMLVAIGVALVMISGAAWLAMTRRSPPPVAPTMPLPPVVVEAKPVPTPATTPVVSAVPTVESPPPKPAPTADLTWNATVRTSTGPFATTVRPGSKCTVDVGATGGAGLEFHRVALTCGATVVFDTQAPMRGTSMSQTSGSLDETKRPDGKRVYRLTYRDIGTRDLEARPQLEISTERGIARAYHEGVLGGALDLRIDKDSQPHTGELLTEPAK